VSAYHLHPIAKDTIKRWANETQEAVNAKAVSSGGMFGMSSSYFGGGSSNSSPSGQGQIQSTSYIMQYHALGLLYLIREKDRMAITKMVQQFGGSGKGGSSGVLRNPMAICMLIKYASRVMEDDPK
jgi:coatomer protein complex subunit gamma